MCGVKGGSGHFGIVIESILTKPGFSLRQYSSGEPALITAFTPSYTADDRIGKSHYYRGIVAKSPFMQLYFRRWMYPPYCLALTLSLILGR